jgi:excisionase family DNA binding protein
MIPGIFLAFEIIRRYSMSNAKEKVPIYRKTTLTIREAAEYSNIGINKIDKLLRSPNCPFVLYVGTKKLVKRKEFEEFLGKELII